MTDLAAPRHYLFAMRLALLLLAAACVTEPDEDLVISKVAYREIPFSRTMLTIGIPCWEMEIPAPYECAVSLVSADRSSEALMSSCEASPEARPCWRISIDPVGCTDAAHQYLDIVQTEWPLGEHYLIAQCVSL